MTNQLIKIIIDAPATVNKVKGVELTPDPAKGKYLRIDKMWLSIPSLDAHSSADVIQFQISTQNQNEAASLYDITSLYQCYTWAKTLQFTQLDQPGLVHDIRKAYPVDDIAGTFLKSGQKYYLNQFVDGQDGGLPMNVVLSASYVDKVSFTQDTEYETGVV